MTATVETHHNRRLRTRVGEILNRSSEAFKRGIATHNGRASLSAALR